MIVHLPKEITVKIESDLNFNPFELLRFTPHVSISESSFKSVDYLFKISKSKSLSLKEYDSSLELSDFDEQRVVSDASHLLGAVSKRLMIEKNVWPIHAAAIENKGQVILIAGHSNSGKTSVVLDCYKLGESIVSTNTCFVDVKQRKFLAGTKLMTVRGKVNSDNVKVNQLKDGWFSWNISASDSNADISKIVLIYAGREHSFQTLEHPSSLHRIFPYFGDIMNKDCIVGDGANLFTYNISNEIKKELLTDLNLWLPDLQIFEICGSSHYIAKEVLK